MVAFKPIKVKQSLLLALNILANIRIMSKEMLQSATKIKLKLVSTILKLQADNKCQHPHIKTTYFQRRLLHLITNHLFSCSRCIHQLNKTTNCISSQVLSSITQLTLRIRLSNLAKLYSSCKFFQLSKVLQNESNYYINCQEISLLLSYK